MYGLIVSKSILLLRTLIICFVGSALKVWASCFLLQPNKPLFFLNWKSPMWLKPILRIVMWKFDEGYRRLLIGFLEWIGGCKSSGVKWVALGGVACLKIMDHLYRKKLPKKKWVIQLRRVITSLCGVPPKFFLSFFIRGVFSKHLLGGTPPVNTFLLR